jgi:hypothetical protein
MLLVSVAAAVWVNEVPLRHSFDPVTNPESAAGTRNSGTLD